MSTDEKQEAIDFMEAQRVALAITELMKGERCAVIGQALSLVIADFVRSGGPDPARVMGTIFNSAAYFYNQHAIGKDEPPPSVN